MNTEWNGPPPIYVFCTVAPSKTNGLTKPYTHRVGTCRERKDIAKIVGDDLMQAGKTYGGLFDAAGTKGRTYRAFETEWSELDIATELRIAAR